MYPLNCIKIGTAIDSSCGTGGFLVTAMTHVIAQLEAEFSEQIGLPQKDWDYDTKKLFQEKISDMAAHNYFGFDINPDLVKATKMNMVMNNDGSGNILQTNSLLPPHEWTDEFRTKLAEALGIKKEEIRNHKTLEFFDVIVTNPPFGSKIKYVQNENLTNSSLRERFALPESSSGSVSRLIKEAVNKQMIKPFDPDTAPRYMKYIPIWA